MAKKYEQDLEIVEIVEDLPDLAEFEPIIEVVEAVDEPESRVEPVEATKPLRKVNTFVAMPGDSYASLAASLCPEGMTKHEYAKLLFALNGGKALIPGAEVKLG